MVASVPFEFKKPSVAQKAYQQFQESSVLEITTPTFDDNGCPLKTVVQLTKLSTLKAGLLTNTVALEHPAQSLHLSLGHQRNHEDLGHAKFSRIIRS